MLALPERFPVGQNRHTLSHQLGACHSENMGTRKADGAIILGSVTPRPLFIFSHLVFLPDLKAPTVLPPPVPFSNRVSSGWGKPWPFGIRTHVLYLCMRNQLIRFSASRTVTRTCLREMETVLYFHNHCVLASFSSSVAACVNTEVGPC